MNEELVRLKKQVYKDPRPPETFAKFHARTRAKEPNAMYELVRMVLWPIVLLFFRTRCISSDRVPASGPVILAPNHFSNMDHFLLATFLRRRVNFVAKSQLFNGGLVEKVFHNGGVFPVRRGHRDEESFITMHEVLKRGGVIVMYAEGGRSRTGKLSDRVKPGIGRLALESGAPIVPIAVYGSAKARNWKRGQLPKVTVQYGEPFCYEQVSDPTRDQQQAVAEQIFAEVRDLYA
ncbi:MAG: 1-acyl-sn-glycerol-3-phosphate acyltransferase, partial [Chloroflexota bacterium]|nr:1-acyl-sn-glycerol-3-phosphate acyltransferase [Chloroflexota bacterium]